MTLQGKYTPLCVSSSFLDNHYRNISHNVLLNKQLTLRQARVTKCVRISYNICPRISPALLTVLLESISDNVPIIFRETRCM